MSGMRLLVIITLLLSIWTGARAQDPTFTQLFAFPLELNPALTGAYEGSFRLSAIYRDQWGGLVENPWQSYGISGDLRFNLTNRANTDYIGAGVEFLADRVALFDFNTLGIKLSGAFHKHLNANNKQYLSGGFNVGLIQRNVNFDALEFNDQFNGLDGYTNSTQEDLPINNYAFFDIGLGLNYAISPNDDLRLSMGGALQHINNPSASFSARTPEIEEPDEVQLYMRWLGYVSANIVLNNSVDIIPRVAVSGQKTSMFANVGANVRFDLNKYETSALQLGLGLQLAQDLGSITPASGYLFAGLELGSVLLGFSYDMNLDDLQNERDGQGIFEFSITYIGQYENISSFCPQF